MAVLLEKYGTVPEWGIAEDENEALLLTSVNMDSSITTEHVQKNRHGQTIGWMGIDQESSFDLSGTLLMGKTVTETGYTLGKQAALNNFAMGSGFNEGIGVGGHTAVIKNVKCSMGNEQAVTVDMAGVVYNFGAAAE